MKKSVLVALSGGIDSTIAALLLKKKGYAVRGVHFNFFPGGYNQHNHLDQISDILGIPVLYHDAMNLFTHEVIDYFTRFHLSGRTPSPCAHCNPNVKYKLLLQLADRYKIQHIATGHYIRLKKQGGICRIYKSTFHEKDQSYYLWGLKQNVLNRLITPLGIYNKKKVQEIARQNGLNFLHDKKESTGLCFAQGRTCGKLLEDYIPDIKRKIKPGNILNTEGQILGSHKGYVYYTIGQKRDLEIDAKSNLCVVKINARHNTLVVDSWENLYAGEFMVTDSHFINQGDLIASKNIQVKIRGFGLNPDGNCHLVNIHNKKIKVCLDEPAWALAPGQPAVFYSGDLLLGGGIITE